MTEQTDPTGQPRVRAVTAVELRNVIVRGCVDCGAPRQIDTPCGHCGLTDPPLVHDLGVMSARYKNPFRQAWWRFVRAPAAARRARRANQSA